MTPGIRGVQIADWLTHVPFDPPRSSPPQLIDRLLREYGGDPLQRDVDAFFAAGADDADYPQMTHMVADQRLRPSASSADKNRLGRFTASAHQVWHGDRQSQRHRVSDGSFLPISREG